MIAHPLLQPKKSSAARVGNFAHDLATREPEPLDAPVSVYRRGWLGVLAVFGLLAVLTFMLVPVLTITFGETTSSFLENVKDLANFGSPTLLIVALLAGATGYYGYGRIAWWLSFGFWLSIAVLIVNIATGVNWFNFGIFWIIIGTLSGLFIGCAFELVGALRRHRERYLIALLIIGMLSTAAATFVAVQNSVKERTAVVTLVQAQQALSFPLFEPTNLPSRYSFYEPKFFVINGEFHVYYGDENYPPPPVIDFLKGLEVIESPGIAGEVFDELTTYARLVINGYDARYRESRGRSIMEWQQGETYITVISHSPINSREFIDFARSFVPFVP